jgi:hypothetical protein
MKVEESVSGPQRAAVVIARPLKPRMAKLLHFQILQLFMVSAEMLRHGESSYSEAKYTFGV